MFNLKEAIDPTPNQTLNMLIEALHFGDVTVSFVKSTGEIRVMRCTLRNTYIPEEAWPKGTFAGTETDQIRVYDIEAGGWRSFNYKNLMSFEFMAPNGELLGVTINSENENGNN